MDPAPTGSEPGSPADTVTTLADEFVAALFDAEPLLPAVLGLEPTRTGLGDVDEATERSHRERFARLAEQAAALDPSALDARDRVTRDVLISQARSRIDQIDARLVEFTITDFFVAPASSLFTLLPMIGVADADQGEAHLGRLAAIPAYLDGVARRHRAGVAGGRTPVAHLVRAAIEHLDRYLAAPADDPLARQPAVNGEFAARRARLLDEVVRPAFAAYRAVLADDIAAHGRPDDRAGVCHLPDGQALYTTLARIHTTTEYSPERLHAIGLEIIEGLADEYATIGGRVFGTGDLDEVFRRLRTDPALRWGGAEELLDTARSAITRAEREAPRWFGRIPPQPWVVEPVPPAEAPGAAAAYYLLPSADGSRPGTYFANTYRVTERFRHTAEVTAFHEAIPGHHFQLSTALGRTDLPLLRRIGDFNAYSEGWGLYAERLADEMGLYSDDVALLGMLSMDSMRAGRLVVDTGLHALGWSRRQAIEFLERTRRCHTWRSSRRWIATSGIPVRHCPTWWAGWRSSGCARRPSGGWGSASTSAVSTTWCWAAVRCR